MVVDSVSLRCSRPRLLSTVAELITATAKTGGSCGGRGCGGGGGGGKILLTVTSFVIRKCDTCTLLAAMVFLKMKKYVFGSRCRRAKYSPVPSVRGCSLPHS